MAGGAVENHFSAVVFAGGGSRCVWQVGFWEGIAPALKAAPKSAAAVSAGAAMACFVFSGCGPEALDYFKEITGKNPKNFYLENLATARPIFPHLKMYRGTLLRFLTRERLRLLHEGPDVRILMSRPPAWAGPRLAVFFGYLCYQIEKSLYAPLHPVLARKIGFKAEVGSVRDCADPGQLADLILASSCTPPFTPVLRWNGGVVLDGGLIGNVPEQALKNTNGNILYLLTRRYSEDSLPRIPGRTYVQPSRPVGISKWDYTNPTGIQDTYDLGRRDGRAWIESQS